MKFIDEYRDRAVIEELAREIKSISKTPMTFMEVCGGHTMAIHRFGIPALLPDPISLISGPGCPVCVTDKRYIDKAIAYARLADTIVTTYGDLIRVPGSTSSLMKEKAQGRDIRIVYSSLDALTIAQKNPDKNVIFLGIGFETTTPATAAAILRAKQQNLKNFFVYSAHKIMPPAMRALIDEGIKLDGYLAPGHVSVITGTDIYNFIARDYKKAVVVSGFEPVDVLRSIYMMVSQLNDGRPAVEIEYSRLVSPDGNSKAQELLSSCFTLRDDWWRGLDVLPLSGYGIAEAYAKFDAEKQIIVDVEPTKEDQGCICGSILKGVSQPKDCPLFGKVCTPQEPVGACMVSSEGACAAHYKYSR